MQSIKRADKNLYSTTEPIHLSSNETLRRYDNIIGMLEDSWVRVQKNYASDIIPFQEFVKAQSELSTHFPVFQYECVSYNIDSKEIRFENCPYFDEYPEPEIKSFVNYNPSPNSTRYEECSDKIEYKWMLVKDDYTGFDVEESYMRSKHKEET